MRLTQEQKDQALSNRPGAKLVRVGEGWAAVWRNGRDYHGQNVRKVVWAEKTVPVFESGNPDPVRHVVLDQRWVAWWGPEFSSRKRRELIALLLEDA